MWDFTKFGNKTAVIDENETKLTYAELFENGKVLSEHINHRTLVACLCSNSIGSIVGYTGFLNNQIVPMMLSSSLDIKSLENLLFKYKPEYIWLPKKSQINVGTNLEVFDCFDYHLVKTQYNVVPEMNEELALLLTTSGSTGSPKFVRQSYKNIMANTDSIIKYLKIDGDERPITTLPMNYTYGMSIINTHLMVGATILLSDKSLMQKEFWDFFKKYSATSFGGVPYTYEMLKRLRFMRMELPSLKTITQAGGKLSPELHKEFAEFALQKKINFVVMYGQSEATARMAYLPPDKALEKYGSMGIAIPDGKFSLITEQGELIETPNVEGELVYEGNNVTLGYAECLTDLSKGDERNGRLVTGDIAKFDEDGFFYIVGRKKRFLKIYGNRVNLDEVDLLLKEKFSEIECVSTGIDDHMTIFITDSLVTNEVKSYISMKTGLNPSAFNIVYINEIPKNNSGKVLYKELDNLLNN